MTTCSAWKCKEKAKWEKKSGDGLMAYYFCDRHKNQAKWFVGKRLRRIE